MRGPATNDQASPSIHASIPPILHCIIAASVQSAGNLGPAFAHLAHELLDEYALLRTDWLMIERRFEILMESFAALLG